MKKLLTTSCLLVIPLILWSQKTYLHCGQLIDGKNDRIRSEMTIVVEGDKILSIDKGFTTPGADDKVIDLKNKTVLPGLMDMHVHIEGETSKNRYLERFTLNKTDVALRSTIYAKRTLLAGFTTVRDLGGSGVNISMRDAINKGWVIGPRIFTVGKAIGTTGGHADPTNGMRQDLMGDPGPAEGVIDGADDARKAVRKRYKDGSDLIKITATGGVLSVTKNGVNAQFTLEEVEAIVSTAKDYGMMVAAHAHGAEGMKRAVLGGVTTIDHGTLMTEEVADLMIEKGTYYIPTMSAGKYVNEKAKEPGYYPEIIVPKALEIGLKIDDTFKLAYKKGVKIAFGTDAGVFPHGDNGKEFGYMVGAGMAPMEAIRSATSVTSELLGINDRLGSLEAGKVADIVAVDDDPIKNIATLERVSFVMKDGVVYKEE